MTPHFSDDSLAVYIGDCREVMAALPAGSVHCVVTSPPYWGLRDYGETGQLGLEPTPEEYVANMVEVFRGVRRVLRDDGTVWLNLGDSYAAARGGTTQGPDSSNPNGPIPAFPPHQNAEAIGLKHKDLVGIPWRVAFALQADGWFLRSDIIWAKPNPMPESVTDRPTKSHEYVFLLSKSARYYFDADAVREPSNGQSPHDLSGQGYEAPEQTPQAGNRQRVPAGWDTAAGGHVTTRNNGRQPGPVEYRDVPAGRNIRTVWNIATQPYPGAHFATFPEKLVEPCVKAGTSERGVCPECGAPWGRVVERGAVQPEPDRDPPKRLEPGQAGNVGAGNMGFRASRLSGQEMARWKAEHPDTTTGWRPSCAHTAEPVSATVLDPFAGSGTVGRVANRLGRRAVLIDLSADYIDQAMLRNAQAPLGLGA